MLSAVITAWNEEKNLPRLVNSLSGLVDEIILVDTESTDRTVDVAKQLGCLVYSHTNTQIVEPVRNFSISKASGDWILVLDADEEMTSGLASEIKKIISGDLADYCRIPRKNIIFGKWVKTSHWWPDYVYRLFKKGAVTWQEQIHSVPLTRGRALDLAAREDISLIHHHYESVSQYVDRLNRYTDVQARQLAKSGYVFSPLDLLDKPAAEFLNQFFARRGYAEGLHGLALSLLQSFSESVLYLKLWQIAGFKPHHLPAAQVDKSVTRFRKDYFWWRFGVLSQSGGPFQKIWNKLRRKLIV